MKDYERKLYRSALYLSILLFSIACIQCSGKENKSLSQPVPDSVMAELDRLYSRNEVEPGVWMIREDNSVNMFLVLGEKKALLIDTGYGRGDLDIYISCITSLPLMVMNTHGHPDHSGGNGYFEEIYVHQADIQDARDFARGKSIYTSIREGYVFDLGGRQLSVIETPGHTTGSVVLLDTMNRLLFTGDNNNSHIWLFLAESLPLETYMNSLERLLARSGEFDVLYPGHGDAFPSSFLTSIHTVGSMVLRGEGTGAPYRYFADATAFEYDGVTLVVNPGKLRE